MRVRTLWLACLLVAALLGCDGRPAPPQSKTDDASLHDESQFSLFAHANIPEVERLIDDLSLQIVDRKARLDELAGALKLAQRQPGNDAEYRRWSQSIAELEGQLQKVKDLRTDTFLQWRKFLFSPNADGQGLSELFDRATAQAMKHQEGVAAILAGVALSACDDGTSDTPQGKAAAALGGFKQENSPENLKAMMELIREMIHDKKDLAKANTIFRGMIPDAARFASAIREDVEPGVRDGIIKMHRELGEAAAKEDKGIGTLCKPEQTVVMVHGATTEEIIQYEKGSVAFIEFPGGARQVAEQVLKPGMTFYQVEFLEPGKDAGMKYHLFYWDGKQWSMIGPAWRTFR